MASILVVEDTKSIRTSLRITLTRAGHDVDEAADGGAARAKLEEDLYDLVITDLRLGEGLDGVGVLEEVKARDVDIEVIIVTAFGTVAGAVEAMKKGAHDYLTKPYTPEQILHAVGNALERRSLRSTVRNLSKTLLDRFDIEGIVGESERMRSVLDLIGQWSPSDGTILITGETGTGKDLVARALYAASPRREKPFVIVNCAAIPDNLFESELFGHVRGAFSGAHNNKKGLAHEAENGTLFLDEIGETPLAVQAKLLRFLETGELRPVGATKSATLDVRVIAATNRDLQTATLEKKFREDLFYRLNVLPIHLPSLRDRREDVALLASHFLDRYAVKAGKTVSGLSKKAQLLLKSYDWPGNVRELENVMERAVMLVRGSEVRPEHLLLPGSVSAESSELAIAAGMTGAPPGASAAASADGSVDLVPLAEVERRHILSVLKASGGNQKKSAATLGISKSTLWRKLKEYGVEASSLTDG